MKILLGVAIVPCRIARGEFTFPVAETADSSDDGTAYLKHFINMIINYFFQGWFVKKIHICCSEKLRGSNTGGNDEEYI